MISLWALFACACWAERAPNVLMIPLYPVEQTLSEEMQLRLQVFESEGALLALASWDRLPELPAWVFEQSKREIAFVIGRPNVSDGYRYAVIAGARNKLIIVRAGGLDGHQEIFVRKKTKTKAR
jgi:hypothetical protein